MTLTKREVAQLALAEAIEALEALKKEGASDPRRVALALTAAEEAALWLGAAFARDTLPEALRRT